MLVQARDEGGEALTDEDLRDDLLTLIAAGHETTAAAIAWGAALLAHNPDVRGARRRGESGRRRLPGALVKEVLRIRPRFPWRRQGPDEPFAIGSHTIPAGTLILIDAWGVHHDPERHPRSRQRFRPERFLGEAPSPTPGCRSGAARIDASARRWPSSRSRPPYDDPGQGHHRSSRSGAHAHGAPGITIVPYGGGRIRVTVSRCNPGAPAPTPTTCHPGCPARSRERVCQSGTTP